MTRTTHPIVLLVVFAVGCRDTPTMLSESEAPLGPGVQLAEVADPQATGNLLTSVTISDVSSELTEGVFLRSADNLLNGSGRDPNGPGTHEAGNPENFGGTMWLTDGNGASFSETDDPDPFVAFDLGGVFDLESVRIWNYNETQPYTPRGVDGMLIEISTDRGASFTPFVTVNLQEAPAANDVPFAESFSLQGAVGVTHVRFDILSNHLGDTFVDGVYTNGENTQLGFAGLSEVEFSGSPRVIDGNVTLTTQEEVDRFAAMEVTGNVTVTGADITNLRGLASLRSASNLIIQANPQLLSLDGLGGVTMTQAIWIDGNPKLGSLEGLPVAPIVGMEAFTVSGNAALETLNGLHMTSELTYLSIGPNPLLSDMEALRPLTSVGYLSLTNNGYENLSDLSGLTTIESSLVIGGHANLIEIDGLSQVEFGIDFSTVRVGGNARLENVDGLARLTSASHLVTFGGNPALTNLDGLAGLQVTDVLEVEGNAVLADCAGLTTVLSSSPSVVLLADNAPGCNSVEEVLAHSVYDGDLALTSQADVEDFSYAVVSGNLSVSGMDITNLDGLTTLRAVDGSLLLRDNEALTDITGLSHLVSLGWSLQVHRNVALPSLDGLEGVTSVNSLLRIEGNNSLLEFDALSSMTRAGQVRIVTNGNLTSLYGLSSLGTVDGRLHFAGTRYISDLMALSSLNSVGEDLIISGHSGLENMDGLEGLTSIPGDLVFSGNDLLQDVGGLIGVTAVGERLWIESNAVLPDLNGLASIGSIGSDLLIRTNSSLSDCSGLAPVLEGGAVGGAITIENNASGCSSLSDVVGNTSTGTDIEIVPVDGTTGEPAPIGLTFDNVTGSGETTVGSFQIGSSGPPPPSNFRLGAPPTGYNIETTATFEGAVEVCIDYSGISYGGENNLKLLHYENGAWVDVTTSLDTTNDVICGSVASFSPFVVAETNVAPELASLVLPPDPLALGTEASVSAAFTDGNPGDVHSGTIDWGDGNTTAAVVSEAGGTGAVSGSYTYADPGVYTVTVIVEESVDPSSNLSDTISSAANSATTYVVMFDPSAGFVTGGGWIESPPGACSFAACTEETTGRASFGFVSRYKKGASVPSGNTEFRFRAGDLHFASASYDWLVPAGGRAQFRGEGQINGGGSYGFLITAIDAESHPQWAVDRFRIKIWETDSGTVLYDNQPGKLDDSDASTEVGGGSISIHGN